MKLKDMVELAVDNQDCVVLKVKDGQEMNLISLGCGVGFWPEYTWGAPGEGIRLLPIDDARCVRRMDRL